MYEWRGLPTHSDIFGPSGHYGRIRLGLSCFSVLSEKHFCYRKIIETVFHAKKHEARNTQRFTVLSVKHFFYGKSASC